jgi:hypothetical protein
MHKHTDSLLLVGFSRLDQIEPFVIWLTRWAIVRN